MSRKPFFVVNLMTSFPAKNHLNQKSKKVRLLEWSFNYYRAKSQPKRIKIEKLVWTTFWWQLTPDDPKKEKRPFCLVFIYYSIKQAREIRKFHVAVVHYHLTNVQKTVMHKLPIVVIQKFCYHANVTSQFSSLLHAPRMTHNSMECWSQLK